MILSSSDEAVGDTVLISVALVVVLVAADRVEDYLALFDIGILVGR
jgi:hypothetical protein